MRFPSTKKNTRAPSLFESGSLFDKLFQDTDREFFSTGLSRFNNTDIYKKDGEVNYEMELPGINKDDIKVQVRDNKLVVSGEFKKKQKTENRNYIARGRRYGKFQRSFPLPKNINNKDELTAKFVNGILHIQVPLTKESEEKEVYRVEIK